MAWNPEANDIFLKALEVQSPEGRRAYLDAACRDELRPQVEALLSASEKAGSFLESPAPALVATVDEPISERPGTVIGPYKLLEQIGEGGFGIVFMAEQQQPIRRKVALKVLKPGMDTRQVIARFEAERQALALMDHPNIAKVLDAGQTSGGRPYFVMDLVKGVPITEFCDQSQLTPRERLELFGHVCQAVQHAHQKGIIHRDLKPSNVLVTLHDGTPLVKIIDFGIAKALGQQLTDKTLYTGFAQMIGTPLYMSPEQAALSNVDVDTRSDIYSLGVLLYELLTGTTPFAKERFSEVGYDELRRIIREEEPPKPSTRISTLGQAATTVSTQRKSDPKRLSQLLRGELDWIVMKALEKDRNRRYETASAFAADVQHYLHDEPVQACPPSAWYRFRKLIRRNKVAFAMGSLVSVAFLAAVAILAISNVRVEKEKGQKEEAFKEAKANEELARQNLQLALKALDRIYLQVAEERLPRDPHRKQEDTQVLQKALEFYQQFAQQNSADSPVRLEVSRAHRRVGDIQAFVGANTAAEDAYRLAIGIAQKLAEEDPNNADYVAELATAHIARGEHLLSTGQARSTEEFRQAIARLSPLLAQFPTVQEYRAPLARAHHGLANALKRLGDRASGELEYQEALELQTKLAEEFPAVPQYRAVLAEMHGHAGTWYLQGPRGLDRDHLQRAGELMEGLVREFPKEPKYRQRLAYSLMQLANFRRAIDLQEKLVAEFPAVPDYRRELAITHCNWGVSYYRSGNRIGAAENYRKALEICDKLGADFPEGRSYQSGWSTYAYNLAVATISLGKDPAEARTLLEKAIDPMGNPLTDFPHNHQNQWTIFTYVTISYFLSDCLSILGEHAQAARRLHQAEHSFSTAFEFLRKSSAGPATAASFCQDLAEELCDHIVAWRASGRAEMAERSLARTGKILERMIDLDPNDGKAWSFRARLYLKMGQLTVADCTKAIKLDPKNANAWNYRATAYMGLHQYDNAIADYQEALRLKPDYAEAHYNLGVALGKKGRLDEAIAEFREALRLKKDFPEAHTNLGGALAEKGRLDEAIAEYQEALRLKMDDPAANNNLAWLLATCADLKFRNHQQAVELAKRAVALAPKEGNFWNTLGVTHYRAGDWKSAIEALTKSMELLKGQAEGFNTFFLAMAHRQQGENEKARHWYEKAVQWMDKNQPKDEELRRFRAESEELLRIEKKALPK